MCAVGSGIRLGGGDEKIRGRAGPHVVAQHARAGLALSVRSVINSRFLLCELFHIDLSLFVL